MSILVILPKLSLLEKLGNRSSLKLFMIYEVRMHPLIACSGKSFGYVNVHCHDWFATLLAWAVVTPNHKKLILLPQYLGRRRILWKSIKVFLKTIGPCMNHSSSLQNWGTLCSHEVLGHKFTHCLWNLKLC